jgi:ferredoxin
MMSKGYGNKGTGRGRGCGGGRGQGMGRGRGIGRGLGKDRGNGLQDGYSPPAPRDTGRQARDLRSRVQKMMDQLRGVHQRIAEINTTGDGQSKPMGKTDTPSNGYGRFPKITAVIDLERCMNCGMCIDICPEQAIDMNPIMVVDSSKCTGCGSCIDECPNEAVSLSETMASQAASIRFQNG